MCSNARSLGENDWCRAPYSKEDFLMTATGRKTGAKRLFTSHNGCVDVVHCNDDDSFRKEY